MNTKSKLILGLCSLIITSNTCFSEIYKYQDKDGNWQFSDKPKNGNSTNVYGNEKQPDTTADNNSLPNSAANSKDIKTLLFKKYKPGNLIEQASIATVTIKTPIGLGSGFFISADGYILTNKHVIRPSESENWDETNKAFRQQKKEFTKNKKILDEEKEYIKELSDDLKRQKKNIASEVVQAHREKMLREYNYNKDQYLQREQHYLKIKKNFDIKYRAFEKERSNFNIKSSMATVKKNFKIILKNEKTLSARLVSVSKKHDLALLKLDRHTTPYIKTNKARVHQTMEVYAIGSPLGIRDSVTSGIITGIKEGYVLTDTKILPGNSGGPLLNKEGAAIGVNTARVSEVINAEGLGIAIPMAIAHKEFAKYLTK